jgi:ABC-type transport system involved in multi-copper enzyme maturation permease subunit
LFATAAITIGVSVLLCWAYVQRYDQLSAKEKASLDPTLLSLRGVFLAQLAVGVLGVLFIGSEHTTGMIRTTFTAVPARRRVLAAKATVLAAVSAVAGAVSTLTAFFAGQAILSTKHIGVSFFSPGVPRALLGASAYFVLIALLAFGLGAILRSTPGAISTLFGLVLVLPILVAGLPSPWREDISQVLPGQAGEAMFAVSQTQDLLSPLPGALVFVAWVAAALTAAMVLVTRRDA